MERVLEVTLGVAVLVGGLIAAAAWVWPRNGFTVRQVVWVQWIADKEGSGGPDENRPAVGGGVLRIGLDRPLAGGRARVVDVAPVAALPGPPGPAVRWLARELPCLPIKRAMDVGDTYALAWSAQDLPEPSGAARRNGPDCLLPAVELSDPRRSFEVEPADRSWFAIAKPGTKIRFIEPRYERAWPRSPGCWCLAWRRA